MNKIGFDLVLLCVGDEKQRLLAERSVPRLEKAYGAPFLVVEDSPAGRRIGSGGAVLQALRRARERGDARRVLLLNAGGLNTRTPNYALRGKPAIPLFFPGEETLLDAILHRVAALAPRLGDGLLVYCTDILVDFSSVKEDLIRSTAFCVDAPPSVGARHGVMFPDFNGELSEYLQKAPVDALAAFADGGGAGNTVPVDTGTVWFHAEHVQTLCALADELFQKRGGIPRLDLYEDILASAAHRRERGSLACAADTELSEMIWDRIRRFVIDVHRLQQPFYHFGTTVQVLENLRALFPEKRIFIANSIVPASARVGEGTLLDGVRLRGGTRVGAGCMVTDVDLEDVTVPDRTAVSGYRLKDGRYVAAVLPVGTSPDGQQALMRELWEKPLFYPKDSFSASLRAALSDDRQGRTVSLADCLKEADLGVSADWRQYLRDAAAAPPPDKRYAAYRERILADHFARTPPLKRLRCVCDRVRRSLPVRLNFSGTWTDCMPYCIENGGEVINASVRVGKGGPVFAVAGRCHEKKIKICSVDPPFCSGEFDPKKGLETLSALDLPRAALLALGVTPDTVIEDGIFLCVAVNTVIRGSGLGVSSILLYACLDALCELLGIKKTQDELISCVFAAEQLMGTGGGWQDQGGVVCSGIKSVWAPPGLPQRVTVTPIDVLPGFTQALSDRLVLIPTGQRHFGRFIVTDVMGRYLSGDPESSAALRALYALNAEVRRSAGQGDLDGFASAVRLHWTLLQRLSPLICPDGIGGLLQACAPWTDAVCLCGAGGGGYAYALLKPGVTPDALGERLGTAVLPATVV
ncbi:MAG: hypothetical protein IJK02_04465 [Clostridia bacterium]|nr:hypothetical protein [Clostridia bacterium]